MNLKWRAVVLASVLASGCAAQTTRPPTPPAIVHAAPVVHDLRGMADLAAVFDKDRDQPRIVLLLSPT